MTGAVRDVPLVLPKLHAAQLQIEREATTFNVACCGRRFGKNEFLVSRVLDGGPGKRRGLIDGYSWGWFAPTYKILDDSWRRLTGLLRQIPGAYVNESKYYARMPDGLGAGVLECWSFEAGEDVGRSREYSGGIVVDEAAMVPRLKHTYDTGLSALTVKFPDAETWLASTPKGQANDFYHYWVQGQAGQPDIKSWQYPTWANPYIPSAEIAKKREQLTEQDFRQEYGAEFLDEGVHPIGLQHIAACMGPLSEQDAVVWGVDLARAVDFTVAIGIDARGRVCHLERWRSPWGLTRTRVMGTIQRTLAYVDDTGVGDPLVEDFQRQGCQVVPFVFTARKKQQIVEALIAAIQQHHITLPDGEEFRWLRTELETLQAERTAMGTRYTAPPGLHDDGVMALAMAWHGYASLGLLGKDEGPKGAGSPDRHPGFDAETHHRLKPAKVDPWQTTGSGQPVRPRIGFRGTWR